jgi:intraflagellar transport protein 52
LRRCIKETLITDGILNRAITTFADKGKSKPTSQRDDEMDLGTGDTKIEKDNGLSFVMPYAATLMVQKPAVAILSSGKIAYPMHRPVVGRCRLNR